MLNLVAVFLSILALPVVLAWNIALFIGNLFVEIIALFFQMVVFHPRVFVGFLVLIFLVYIFTTYQPR